LPLCLLPRLARLKGLLALTETDVILVVALFCVGELALSYLLFKLHLRKEPY
jgi:hypothetical protein